ncbi:hypothetical protein H180DRAFT_04036 [Streptomyces sp. WMMB 322]|nr:hypothetical protein H180DRAFT_04036 [Streptomyces sp. WMMB 322]
MTAQEEVRHLPHVAAGHVRAGHVRAGRVRAGHGRDAGGRTGRSPKSPAGEGS